MLSVATDTFLTQRNLLNILDQSAPLGIVACAITICHHGRHLRPVVGRDLRRLGRRGDQGRQRDRPRPSGLLPACWPGSGLGIANGVVIHYTRINSFIGTLATSIVYRGVAILVTGGAIVTVTDPAFAKLGTQDAAVRRKWSVWVFWRVLRCSPRSLLARTTFGRYVYAVGGNEEAARLSGVRVGARARRAASRSSGLAAGIAGVLAASRTSSAQANLGVGLELSAIAAAVVGGTSILGGEGAVWRGVLGVLTLAIIGNGFNLLDIDTTYQQLVQGVPDPARRGRRPARPPPLTRGPSTMSPLPRRPRRHRRRRHVHRPRLLLRPTRRRARQEIVTAKSDTTPPDFERGVLERAREERRRRSARSRFLAHGTTRRDQRADRAQGRQDRADHHRGLPRLARDRARQPARTSSTSTTRSRRRSCRATCAARCRAGCR